MNRTALLILAIVSLTLTACAAPPPRLTETESGRPEVFIENVTVEAVHDRILERLLSGGARIDSESASRITVSKEMTGQRETWTRLAIANSYSTPVRVDIAFSLVRLNSGVKVFAQMSAWSQMPLGQISRIDLNGNADFNEMQQSLYTLRDSFTKEIGAKPIRSIMLTPTTY